MRRRARSRRRASCSARRSKPVSRSSWWSTRLTVPTRVPTRSCTRSRSCSWTLTPTSIRSTSRSCSRTRAPGHCGLAPDALEPTLQPLFDALLAQVPAPTYDDAMPLQALVTNLDASPYVGRLALCRVRNGTLRRGQQVAWCRTDGSVERVKIVELTVTEALDRVDADEAGPGGDLRGRGDRRRDDRRDPRRPRRPETAAGGARRRAVAVDDDRDQHGAPRRARTARRSPRGSCGRAWIKR